MSQPSNTKPNPQMDPKTNPTAGNINGQGTTQPNQGAQPGKSTNQPPPNPQPAGNTTNQPKPQGTTQPGQPVTQPQPTGNTAPNQPYQGGTNPKPAQPTSGQTQPQPAMGGIPGQPGAFPQQNPQTGTKPAPGQPAPLNQSTAGKPPGQNTVPGKQPDGAKGATAKGATSKPTTAKGAKSTIDKTAHSDGEDIDGEEVDLVKIGGKTVHIKQVYQQREDLILKELETKRKKLAGAQTKLKELLDEHRKIAEQPIPERIPTL